MRKGDEKRAAMLDAAEQMFCERGFENSSVQDLMKSVGTSKGGFYHYFTGKEEILAALCERRAVCSAEALEGAFAHAASPMERIDAVLYAFQPLRLSEAAFLKMLLPYLQTTAARNTALAYQDALQETFLPIFRQEIEAAKAAGTVYPEVKGMESAVLHLVNRCWLDAVCLMNGDASELLNSLNAYRRAVELLLGAPFGSITIVRVEELAEIARITKTV